MADGRVRMMASVPLCLLALALALVAFNSHGEPSVLAAKLSATKPQAAAKQVKQTMGLQQLELIHVKKCAKEITGSDKPRKLPPAQAKAVNECAKKFMPPTQTKALLQAAAKKILQANHQKADAASVKKLMSSTAEKPVVSAGKREKAVVVKSHSKAAAKRRLAEKAAADKH